ncbi:hypothetical protein PMAYCL1PPCAC_00636, partial [Pristionchus mayeri]
SRVVRTESFGDGLTHVSLKLLVFTGQSRSMKWCAFGSLRCVMPGRGCFASASLPPTPPHSGAEICPSYVFPSWRNKSGFWIRSISDRYARQGCLLTFCLSRSGVISYSVNRMSMGTFMEDINTTRPLWVVVDVYGKTKAIEFESVDLTLPSRDNREVQPAFSVQRELATRLAVASPSAHPTPIPHSFFSSLSGDKLQRESSLRPQRRRLLTLDPDPTGCRPLCASLRPIRPRRVNAFYHTTRTTMERGERVR